MPRTSLELLERVVDGERTFLAKRGQPVKGVHKSAAFRTIWELGEVEYLLQRASLWVTRKTNRYTVEQAAELLGWDPRTLWRMFNERGIQLPEPTGEPAATRPPPEPERATKLDPRFLV